MNVHKSRKIRKGVILPVYPLGVIEEPSSFCDILSKRMGHVACVVSMPCLDKEELKQLKNNKKEQVIWNGGGFPDVYVKDKKITFGVMKRALKLLEKDDRNRFRYRLIKKNFLKVV